MSEEWLQQDALAVAKKELSLYYNGRKGAGQQPYYDVLLQFYDRPVWRPMFHPVLDPTSRRRLRLFFYVALRTGRQGTDWLEPLLKVAEFIDVTLSPTVPVRSRMPAACDQEPTFSVRPLPACTSLYVRIGNLPRAEVDGIYSGKSGLVKIQALTAPTGVTDEYEITFESRAQMLEAAKVMHPKVVFCGFRNPDVEQNSYASSELIDLNLPPPGLVFAETCPPVVVDNLPYWITAEQVINLFNEFGTVTDFRFAVNDLNGCHFGCCQILMRSMEEAVRAEDELDGRWLGGNIIVVGYLGDDGVIRNRKGGAPKSMGGDTSAMKRLNFSQQVPGGGYQVPATR
eukprot:TRINITY_DN18726_c0_g1_i1.p2 TRINITY_DN18726_c0_g1~~TRINITY_DN18726_c0_g1_i1.p2  ORF type:complete len:342 (+),score=102.01 TRINITY_DN18726_c0_g1_i1:57-1082(+)